MKMYSHYISLVQNGTKTTTIRRGHRTDICLGPCMIFATETEINASALVTIANIVHTSLDQLTDADAVRDGFQTKSELIRVLRTIYGDEITDQEPVTVIAFQKKSSDISENENKLNVIN